MPYDCDATTIERGGRTLRVEIIPDDDCDAPWDRECGHGPVSDWTSRAKLPGEWVLNDDRGSRRYYDAQEAQRIALREGWGFLPAPLKLEADPGDHAPYARRGGRATAGTFTAYDAEDMNRAIASVYAQHRATMTRRQYAAGAVRADFERLRDWCNDRWSYVGVRVVLPCACCGDGEADDASLWGIESDAGAYLEEVAADLADEILSRIEEG